MCQNSMLFTMGALIGSIFYAIYSGCAHCVKILRYLQWVRSLDPSSTLLEGSFEASLPSVRVYIDFRKAVHAPEELRRRVEQQRRMEGARKDTAKIDNDMIISIRCHSKKKIGKWWGLRPEREMVYRMGRASFTPEVVLPRSPQDSPGRPTKGFSVLPRSAQEGPNRLREAPETTPIGGFGAACSTERSPSTPDSLEPSLYLRKCVLPKLPIAPNGHLLVVLP